MDKIDPAKDHPQSKLASYYAAVLDRYTDKSRKTVASSGDKSPSLITDMARFHDFVYAYRESQPDEANSAEFQRLQRVGIDQYRRRLVEGANHVFPQGVIDRSLAAHRRIHLRQ